MKSGRIISSTDFMNRPKWFNTLNYVLNKSQSLGTVPLLKKDELMATARYESGLQDFGRDFWDEPLDRLIHSLNHEAKLHPIGKFISRKRIINLLGVRLRAEEWFKKYPEILDQEVLPPMVIVGLQRTGTTKLHRLLTADPENRVLRSWEAINPAPFQLHMNGKDKRIRIARTSEKALRWMTPGFFAIHPVEHSAPEEDILLLDVTFLSTTPEATTNVPSYSDWLEKTDQSHAYEYGSRLLRLLQWQQPGKRWVLKSPHHLEFLPLIEKYYGEPHFIWTHRDPTECIPSFLSMVCHSRVIFTDDVQVQRVTRHWVRKTAYMLDKGLAYREQAKEGGNFTDVMYSELVKDPMGQLSKIYERYGGIPDPLMERFAKADANNPQGKYGIHEYNLSDFGLSEEDLEQRNSTYFELFNKLSL
ncbi:MAG: sulfotransferase [Bacteroidia bacterium]|nr:MAG: sulfotransferase [Bacteroidia bacterium]